MERLMMTVPNFAPRGVGFRFTEAQLFITTTAATPTELLTATMRQIRCPPFRKRFNEYIESEEKTMTYINEKHRARFTLAVKNIAKANYMRDTYPAIVCTESNAISKQKRYRHLPDAVYGGRKPFAPSSRTRNTRAMPL